MYAIIDTGNQQEKVEVGTVIEVDYIADAKKVIKLNLIRYCFYLMEKIH